MIMLKSTHEKEIMNLQLKYNELLKEWNCLVKDINEKGGRRFLNGESYNSQFSDEEIKTLITLCHPDKHQQK